MARVQVFQRNARVAVPVECEFVSTAQGMVARARVVVISHHVRKAADVADAERRSEPTPERTSIRWTVWGRLAETAARVLVVGSHLNVAGHMRSTRYQDRGGREVFDFDFTVEQFDFLETKAVAQARRDRMSAGALGRDERSAQPAVGAPSKARVSHSHA
jgi:single-stranded DNA-binding protein